MPPTVTPRSHGVLTRQQVGRQLSGGHGNINLNVQSPQRSVAIVTVTNKQFKAQAYCASDDGGGFLTASIASLCQHRAAVKTTPQHTMVILRTANASPLHQRRQLQSPDMLEWFVWTKASAEIMRSRRGHLRRQPQKRRRPRSQRWLRLQAALLKSR